MMPIMQCPLFNWTFTRHCNFTKEI